MSRPAVTVIVSSVGDDRLLLRCLDQLQPTLHAADEVVVVVPAGRRPVVRRARLVAAGPGESVAAAAARLAQVATTPLVADLHSDVVVTPHWLDRLCAALADIDVQAAGPRANLAPPGQCLLDPPYGKGHRSSLRDFARTWAAECTEPDRVVDDLPHFCRIRRQQASAGRCVVVSRVYVQHDAADGCPDTAVPAPDPAAPLLSASLIVKDEEDCLAACLDAVARFADEVVVYDTGSTDATREIAAAHGARVVEGYWDDDFAGARNRSLQGCTGQFVVCVDADEVLRGDPAALRAQLRTLAVEALILPVDNQCGSGLGSGFQHAVVRVFRRTEGLWVGRLHEQVMHPRLGRAVTTDATEHALLEHSGYLSDRIAAKDKTVRNLRIAEQQVAEVGEDDHRRRGVALTNLARSSVWTGDVARSLTLAEQAWAHGLTPRYQELLGLSAARAALSAADHDAVGLWLDRVRAATGGSPEVDAVQAESCAAQGDLVRAEALLAGLPEVHRDADGVEFARASVAPLHSRVLAALGRPAEALDVLVAALHAGVADVHLAALVALARAADRPLPDLARAVSGTLRMVVLAQSLQLPPADAAVFLEALWLEQPGLDVLVTAARVAPQLPVLAALEWSDRLRSAGLADSCPLVAIAGEPERPVRDRAVCAAVALEMYGDQRARPLLARALASAGDSLPAVQSELAQLAPTALRELAASA